MSDEPGDTIVADPLRRRAAHAAKRMSPGDRVRLVVRGVGQTFITAGLVVLLFVVYQVYVTNLFAHREQVKVHNALEKQWAQGKDPLPLPGSDNTSIPLGEGLANLYIPRFGKDFAFTIVEGTDDASLEKGPGHYTGTALPAATGNFAVAGHRVGKGEPFLNLDRLKSGDTIIIETKAKWYVYRVKGVPGDIESTVPDGIAGREIVSPDDGGAISPVPNSPGKAPTEKLMTMTTCHPKFTATQRMIVHAVLDPKLTVARSGQGMPSSIQALYDKVSG
ncbi:MAG: class E sortase [Jatrophihabitantaceae bacterium]